MSDETVDTAVDARIVLILIILEVTLWDELSMRSLSLADVLILIILEVTLWDKDYVRYVNRFIVLILIILEVTLWAVRLIEINLLSKS